MLVYISIIALLFFLNILDTYNIISKKYNSVIYFSLCLIIILIVGLRWETGTDWTPYLQNFYNTTSLEIVLVNALTGFEVGYGLLVLSIRSLTENYTYFLILHSIVFYFLIFYFNKKASPYPYLSFLLFFVSTMGVLGSNRQLLALSICLFALQFLINGKRIFFLTSIILASFIHSTAFIFFIYYFLNRDFSKFIILFSIVLAIIIGNTTLPVTLFGRVANLIGVASAQKADFYKDSVDIATLSIIGLIRRLFYLLLFMFNYNTLKNKVKYYKLLFNGYVFGLIFYFLFSNSLLILVARGSLYFNVMENVLLASLLLLFDNKRDRVILAFLLTIYAFFLFRQSIAPYPDLFLPYKGVFINSDFSREMY